MSKISPSSLAINVLLHARAQQRGIEHDQNKILSSIKETKEENADFNSADFNKTLNNLISNDRAEIITFNQEISNPQFKPHAAIKVNKLPVILNQGLSKIMSDENAVETILCGKLPKNFDSSVDGSIPDLGVGKYYGSGDPSYLSALLHYVSLALDSNDPINSKHSIYHSNPLPDNFNGYKGELSWINQESNCLTVPHGGYAWGGHRGQKTDNPYAPHDCASLVEAYTTPQFTASTADLMCIWNVNTGQFNGWTPESWSREIVNFYHPAMLEDAQIGDIYFHKLLKDTPKDTVYAAGHTAVVFSTAQDSIKTVGVNRDMEREFNEKDSKPGMEGIGFQAFPSQALGKFIGFLRPNDKLLNQMPDPYGINTADWSHEPITEQNMTEYYDSHFGYDNVPLSGENLASAGGSVVAND